MMALAADVHPYSAGAVRDHEQAMDAALKALVAERDEARRERDSWRKLAEGWKLTDDVERHRV